MLTCQLSTKYCFVYASICGNYRPSDFYFDRSSWSFKLFGPLLYNNVCIGLCMYHLVAVDLFSDFSKFIIECLMCNWKYYHYYLRQRRR